jgi:hypothetical protein
MFLKFGQYLEHFEISSGEEIGDEIFEVLPTCLKHVYLPMSEWITDSGIRTLQCFSALETLEINHSRITGNVFRLLPRTLTDFNASKATQVEDLQISDLPRSLTNLELNSASHLTDACVELLPPSLTRFSVKKSEKITVDFVATSPAFPRIHFLTATFTIHLGLIPRLKSNQRLGGAKNALH